MFQVVRFAASFLLLIVAVEAGAQSSYQVVPLTRTGTITGTVKWSGPVPHPATFAINKDNSVCDPESHNIRDLERLVVSPEGGVANAVVFLKNISSGKAMDIPEPRRFLNQRQCRYEPHILLAQTTPLQMKSSDPVLHTVHMEGAASYNLPFPFPNQIISRPMSSAGLVSLKCNGGHVWMNAEVFVIPHPYYAVSDENGRYELTDVPPGEYEIVAWHEGWKVLRRAIMVDVLSQQRVPRPIFSEPKTWEKSVSVDANDKATVNFVISEK
jgi:hypothetical protein